MVKYVRTCTNGAGVYVFNTPLRPYQRTRIRTTYVVLCRAIDPISWYVLMPAVGDGVGIHFHDFEVWSMIGSIKE